MKTPYNYLLAAACAVTPACVDTSNVTDPMDNPGPGGKADAIGQTAQMTIDVELRDQSGDRGAIHLDLARGAEQQPWGGGPNPYVYRDFELVSVDADASLLEAFGPGAHITDLRRLSAGYSYDARQRITFENDAGETFEAVLEFEDFAHAATEDFPLAMDGFDGLLALVNAGSVPKMDFSMMKNPNHILDVRWDDRRDFLTSDDYVPEQLVALGSDVVITDNESGMSIALTARSVPQQQPPRPTAFGKRCTAAEGGSLLLETPRFDAYVPGRYLGLLLNGESTGPFASKSYYHDELNLPAEFGGGNHDWSDEHGWGVYEVHITPFAVPGFAGDFVEVQSYGGEHQVNELRVTDGTVVELDCARATDLEDFTWGEVITTL